MKIVLFADGASIHCEKWIRGLNLNLQAQIDLIHLNPEPVRPAVLAALGPDHIHSFAPPKMRASGGNLQYLLKAPAIRRLVRRLDPDVINTIYLTSYGFLGALCKGRAKLCHFAVGSDILVTPKRSLAYYTLTKWTLSRADLVMSVSGTVGQEISATFNYPSDKLLVQHYGLEPFVLDYPRPVEKYTFVSNRAWVENSNIELIAETLRGFPAEKAAVIGATRPGGEALAERIRKAIRAQSQIEEFSALAYEKNIEVVASSRFLLTWTFTDGTPGSLIEAMAMGTIPIASDTAPNREWVEDGVNGVLIPLGDKASTQAKLLSALRMDDKAIARMAAANKRIVAERATLKTNMGRLCKRLQSLLIK